MIVKVNDKPQEIPEKTSLKDLMTKLNFSEQGTAVALNNVVVSLHKWQETVLEEDDNIIIIRATQGG